MEAENTSARQNHQLSSASALPVLCVVQCIAMSCSLRTCVWPQALLVCADVQHRGIPVQDLLCAVAMVNIKVNNEHLQQHNHNIAVSQYKVGLQL
jgi:hypothetical protein